MNKGRQITVVVVDLFVILGVVLLASCAPAAAPAPAPQAPAAAAAPLPQAPAPQAPAKAAWETEWEMTLAEAKREGTLTFYSTVAGFRETLSTALKKYGIKLESVIGLSAGLTEKIYREQRAGINSVDIYNTGSTSVLSLRDRGVLAPMEPMLILPDVNNPKMWWNDMVPWVDNKHYVIGTLTDIKAPIIINTNVVKPGEVNSYGDLLNPKWKEKIIMRDPSITGGGGKWFGAVLTLGIVDENYMRQLAKQKPVITRDGRMQAEWLAHGKMAIALAPTAPEITNFIRLGAPLENVRPTEGTYVSAGSGCFGVIGKAPHPNAAKFFANWVLTREGQTVTSQTLGIQSARLDVPTDFLDPDSLRQPGVKYTNTENEETLKKIQTYYKVGKEIFDIK